MIGGDDGGMGLWRPRHLGDMDLFAAQIETPGEVEITIEQAAVPGNRNKASAHQAFNRAGVEMRDQFLHVTFKIVGFFQPVAKPSQGNIGKTKEPVKLDTPFLIENLVISFLSCFLVRWQESTGGIGYEVQLQPGSAAAVSDGASLRSAAPTRRPGPPV